MKKKINLKKHLEDRRKSNSKELNEIFDKIDEGVKEIKIMEKEIKEMEKIRERLKRAVRKNQNIFTCLMGMLLTLDLLFFISRPSLIMACAIGFIFGMWIFHTLHHRVFMRWAYE